MKKNLLSQLGVNNNTLTIKEKSSLHEDGYLNLGQLLSPSDLKAIQDRIAELMEEEGEQAGAELAESPHIRHPKEEGADRLADLVNKGDVFDIFYTHPKVLAAVAQVVGEEFKLSSLNYRSAKPGKGLQKLHVDWHEAVRPNDFKVCNSIWLLDNFSKENGATRLVPKTHLKGKMPQEVLADPWKTHPDEIILEAPAGSVFIFNSHLWHGGTTNTTDKARRAVHSYFCRRDQPQQINQKRYILPSTINRISIATKSILDV